MIASGNQQGRVGFDITLPPPQAGRRLVAEDLPDTRVLAAAAADTAHWFGEAVEDKAMRPCIAGRKSRGKSARHDTRRYRIEIMFGRPEDWRRVTTRHDRCPKSFLFAVDACVDLSRNRHVLAMNQERVLTLRMRRLGARPF